MTKEQLSAKTNEVYSLAVNDIQEQLLSFVKTSSLSFNEIAEVMGVSTQELTQLLFKKDKAITFRQFIQILVLTDNSLIVRPIEEVIAEKNQLSMEDDDDITNMPPLYEQPSTTEDTHCMKDPINYDPCQEEGDDIPKYNTFPKRGSSKPNFEAMERDELIKIVRNKLWESEISLDASKEELVKFLNDKDEQFKINQYIESLENDDKIQSFISKLRQVSKEDPNFRKYIRLI